MWDSSSACLSYLLSPQSLGTVSCFYAQRRGLRLRRFTYLSTAYFHVSDLFKPLLARRLNPSATFEAKSLLPKSLNPCNHRFRIPATREFESPQPHSLLLCNHRVWILLLLSLNPWTTDSESLQPDSLNPRNRKVWISATTENEFRYYWVSIPTTAESESLLQLKMNPCYYCGWIPVPTEFESLQQLTVNPCYHKAWVPAAKGEFLLLYIWIPAPTRIITSMQSLNRRYNWAESLLHLRLNPYYIWDWIFATSVTEPLLHLILNTCYIWDWILATSETESLLHL